MGFGKLLSQKLEEKGIRQAELADGIGITRSTLNSILTRDTSKIEIETFLKICKYIGSDPEEFYDHYIREKQKPLQPDFVAKYNALDAHGKRMVDFTLNEEYDRCTACEDAVDEPITISISRSLLPASAGSGEFLSDEYLEPREYPDCENARRADVVIPVSGDSMEPKFHDGDELYVRLQPAVEIGEIGIFIIDGKGYVKEYAEDRLISLNPEYDDVYPSEYGECRCVGKVIGKV